MEPLEQHRVVLRRARAPPRRGCRRDGRDGSGRPGRGAGSGGRRGRRRRTGRRRRGAARPLGSNRGSPRSGRRASRASSAIRRYVVSLPPATLSTPVGPRRNTVSRRALSVEPSAPGSTLRPAKRERTASARSSAGSTATDGFLEDRRDVCVGRRDVVRLSLEELVSRPEQEHPFPGNREGDAHPIVGDRERGRPRLLEVDEDVSALAQAAGRTRSGIFEQPDAVDPRAGRVHDAPAPTGRQSCRRGRPGSRRRPRGRPRCGAPSPPRS